MGVRFFFVANRNERMREYSACIVGLRADRHCVFVNLRSIKVIAGETEMRGFTMYEHG